MACIEISPACFDLQRANYRQDTTTTCEHGRRPLPKIDSTKPEMSRRRDRRDEDLRKFTGGDRTAGSETPPAISQAEARLRPSIKHPGLADQVPASTASTGLVPTRTASTESGNPTWCTHAIAKARRNPKTTQNGMARSMSIAYSADDGTLDPGGIITLQARHTLECSSALWQSRTLFKSKAEIEQWLASGRCQSWLRTRGYPSSGRGNLSRSQYFGQQ